MKFRNVKEVMELVT